MAKLSKDTLNRLRNISRYEAENAHGRKQERTELRHLETDRHMKAIDTMMWCCGDPCTRDIQRVDIWAAPAASTPSATRWEWGIHQDLRRWTEAKNCLSWWSLWFNNKQKQNGSSQTGGEEQGGCHSAIQPLEPNWTPFCVGVKD